MRDAGAGTRALATALRAAGGDLAASLRPDGPNGAGIGDRPATRLGPGPAQIAAAGPRAAGREADYELLVEMIIEGARLHYGEPRVLAPADPDLGLLLGDQLYALGLARLAELGDLEAVAELADLISLVAVSETAGSESLTGAVWAAGARAIGWGTNSHHEQAKALARAGAPEAAAALRAAAGARGS